MQPASSAPGASHNVPQAATAAERNRAAIAEVLVRLLPAQGGLLEVASGAGVHAAHCAPLLPQLRWQPTDLLGEVLPAIDAAAGGLPNVARALQLDLLQTESWQAPLAALRAGGPVVAVLAVNVTHISPFAATLGLLALAAEALEEGGLLCVYGPFSFAGKIEPESNRTFDASLRARNAEWGYRDVEAVEKAAAARGLRLLETVPMPANNHFLIFSK